ncbi:MAG: autotransporter outer membrane beta-barrel domain-containing protein [Magnetococcales bacterium]|nr:autotransporter outer membrane beta-barrel domain-containing protein [Magnetococcales bacterium]
MSASEVHAGCDFQATFEPLKSQYRSNASSVMSGSFCGQSYSVSGGTPAALESGTSFNGTVAGFPFTFSYSGTSLADWDDNQAFTLTISGVQVYSGTAKNLANMEKTNTISTMVGGKLMSLTTSAANWEAAKNSDAFTVTYAGNTIFSGLAAQFGVQDALNILGSIGTLDSGSATQQQVNRTSSQVIATVISTRISDVLSKVVGSVGRGRPGGLSPTKPTSMLPVAGLAAGEPASGGSKGVWGTVGNTWVRGTSPFLPYTGQLKMMLLGGDMKVLGSSLVGVTVGLEDNILNTNFNNGGVDSTGLSITPYVGTSFFDGALIWNASGSYGASKSDTDRLTPGTMTRVTGSYHSRRLLLATNLDGYRALSGATTLGVGVGVLGSWEHRGSYTESDNTTPLKNDTGLGEAKVSATLIHTYQSVSGFVGLSYLYDFFMDQDITTGNREDRDEVSAKIGLDYAVKDNHTLTVDLNNSFGREHTRVTGLMANYRVDF